MTQQQGIGIIAIAPLSITGQRHVCGCRCHQPNLTREQRLEIICNCGMGQECGHESEEQALERMLKETSAIIDQSAILPNSVTCVRVDGTDKLIHAPVTNERAKAMVRYVRDVADIVIHSRGLEKDFGPPPIPMILFCPRCGKQHIDLPQPEKGWDNPPHRSHECQGCGFIWRPADVPTTGVATIKTMGKADSIRFCDARIAVGQNEPLLGLATCGELLDELRARGEMNGWLNYRTVDMDETDAPLPPEPYSIVFHAHGPAQLLNKAGDEINSYDSHVDAIHALDRVGIFWRTLPNIRGIPELSKCPVYKCGACGKDSEQAAVDAVQKHIERQAPGKIE